VPTTQSNAIKKRATYLNLQKNWHQAGSAFKAAGDLNLEHNNRTEAANDYVLASKCFEKYDISNAINFSLSAIQIYTDLGRFTMAAKQHGNIAEIYEHNLELEKAVQHYEQAADYFKVEENYVLAKRCLLKIAEYSSSEFQDYTKAINIYQEIGFYDLKTPILQYNAKDNLFKAGLCHLCIDLMNAKHALDLYLDKYPAFETSMQYGFLKNIIECVEDLDEDAFSRVVRDYDNQVRLDTWHTKILLTIKKQMKEHPNLL
jgi:alpha-soluble NSF attachment protein